MNYIYLIIAGVLGYMFGKRFAERRKSEHSFAEVSKDEMESILKKSGKALTERTEERKEKILEMMKGEAEHQRELQACNLSQKSSQVTSEDVEKLLDVSNDTARKYLNELEDENKIEQIGIRGVGVHYKLRIGENQHGFSP